MPINQYDFATPVANTQNAVLQAAQMGENRRKDQLFQNAYAGATQGNQPQNASQFSAERQAQLQQAIAGASAADRAKMEDRYKILSSVLPTVTPENYGAIRQQLGQIAPDIAQSMAPTYDQFAPNIPQYQSELQMLGGLFSTPQEGFTLAKGAQRFDASGRPVAYNPDVAGPDTVINMGEGDKFYDTLDASSAAMYGTLMDSGMAASQTAVQLNALEDLLANIDTGAGAQWKQWAGNFGIATEGLGDIQAATALINKMVPAQRPVGSGPMSDADLELFKQSMPRIINQPGGNKLIIDTMRKINTYTMKQAEIANRVANRELTPAQGRSELSRLANPLDGFSTQANSFKANAPEVLTTSSGVSYSVGGE